MQSRYLVVCLVKRKKAERKRECFFISRAGWLIKCQYISWIIDQLENNFEQIEKFYAILFCTCFRKIQISGGQIEKKYSLHCFSARTSNIKIFFSLKLHKLVHASLHWEICKHSHIFPPPSSSCQLWWLSTAAKRSLCQEMCKRISQECSCSIVAISLGSVPTKYLYGFESSNGRPLDAYPNHLYKIEKLSKQWNFSMTFVLCFKLKKLL